MPFPAFLQNYAHLPPAAWAAALQKAKAKLTCVSLETSRALPGAEIGKGPVVRLGDKFNVFDANALQALTTLATYALPEKHQRRIMDGGTCEGTVAMTNGISTIGISVPLGNYHNQSFEGGPDSPGPMGPAPEFIHEGDLAGMITLCAAIVSPKSIIKTTGKTKLNFKELWKTPYAQKAKECRKSAQKFKKELAYR